MKKISSILIFSVILIIGSVLNAQVTTSVGDGDWNDPTTWTAGVPSASTPAVVATGNTVTIKSTTAAKAQNVTINGTLVMEPNNPNEFTLTPNQSGAVFTLNESGNFVANTGTTVYVDLFGTPTAAFDGKDPEFYNLTVQKNNFFGSVSLAPAFNNKPFTVTNRLRVFGRISANFTNSQIVVGSLQVDDSTPAVAATIDFSNSSVTLGGFNVLFDSETGAKVNLSDASLTFSGPILNPKQYVGADEWILNANTKLYFAGTLAQTIYLGNGINQNTISELGFNNAAGVTFNGNNVSPAAAPNPATLTINDKVTMNAGSFVTTANAHIIYGANAELLYESSVADMQIVQGSEWPATNGPNFVRVNMFGGGDTWVKLAADRNVPELMTLSTGEFNDGGFILTIDKDLTNNATHAGTGSIYLNNLNVHNLAGTGVYGNVELDNSAGVVGAILNSSMTIENGVLLLTAGNLQVNAGSDVTISDTGELVSTGTGASANVLVGDGIFNLNNGWLRTEEAGGWDGTITTTGGGTVLTESMFEFNGTVAQVTGAGLTGEMSTLVIDNTAGVTMSNDTYVKVDLNLDNGEFALNDNALTVGVEGDPGANPGTGALTVTSGSLTGSALSDLIYNGNAAVTFDIANGLENFEMNGGAEVTLAAGFAQIAGNANIYYGTFNLSDLAAIGNDLVVGDPDDVLRMGDVTLTSDLSVTGSTVVGYGTLTATDYNFATTDLYIGSATNATDGDFINNGVGDFTVSGTLAIERGTVTTGSGIAMVNGSVLAGNTVKAGNSLLTLGADMTTQGDVAFEANAELNTQLSDFIVSGSGLSVRFDGVRTNATTGDAGSAIVFRPNTNPITLEGNAVNIGNVELNDVVKLPTGGKVYLSSEITVHSIAILNGELNASMVTEAGYDMYVTGDWMRDVNGTFIPGTNTVTFNGTTAQSIDNTVFYNLVLDNSAIVSPGVSLGNGNVDATNTLNINAGYGTSVDVVDLSGDLIIGQNGTLDNSGNYNIFIEGNWTNAAEANFIEGTGLVVFDGAPAKALQTVNTTGGEVYYNLTVASSAQVEMQSDVTVDNALEIGDVVKAVPELSIGSGNTLTLNATIGGTAPANLVSGSNSNLVLGVNFVTSPLPAFASFELFDFTNNAVAVIALGSDLKIYNNFGGTGTEFQIVANTLTLVGDYGFGGLLTGGFTSNLVVDGDGTGDLVLPALELDNYTQTANVTRMVSLNAFDVQTQFSVSGGTAMLLDQLDVLGNVEIANGVTVDVSTFDVTVGGNWNNLGTFNANMQTVTFNGAAPQTLGGSTVFYDVELNSTYDPVTGTALVFGDAAGDNIVSNDLIITDGKLDLGALLDLNGDLTIEPDGVFDCVNFKIEIAGNWVNNGGQFIPNTGEVDFDGTEAQTVTEKNFYDLTITNPLVTPFTLGSGADVDDVMHTLTVKGSQVTMVGGTPKVVDQLGGDLNIDLSGVVVFDLLNFNILGNVNLLSTITTGYLDQDPCYLFVGGNWNNEFGPDAFIEGTSAVIFNGTGVQTTTAEVYFLLGVAKTDGNLVLNGDVTVAGQFGMLNTGTADLNGNTLLMPALIYYDVNNPFIGSTDSKMILTSPVKNSKTLWSEDSKGLEENLYGPLTLESLTLSAAGSNLTLSNGALTIGGGANPGALNLYDGNLDPNGQAVNLSDDAIVTYDGTGAVVSAGLTYNDNQVDFVFLGDKTITEFDVPGNPVRNFVVNGAGITVDLSLSVLRIGTELSLLDGTFDLVGGYTAIYGNAITRVNGQLAASSPAGMGFFGTGDKTWDLGSDLDLSNLDLQLDFDGTVSPQNGNLTVRNLSFVNGYADAGSNYIEYTSMILNASDNSHSISPMAKNLSAGQEGLFPVGDGTTYHPATFKSNTTAPGLTKAQFFNAMPTIGTDPNLTVSGSPVSRASEFYWTLDPENDLSAATDVDVRLDYPGFTDPFTPDRDDMRIVFNNGTDWFGVQGTYATGTTDYIESLNSATDNGLTSGAKEFTYGLYTNTLSVGGTVLYGGTTLKVGDIDVEITESSSASYQATVTTDPTTGLYEFPEVPGINNYDLTVPTDGYTAVPLSDIDAGDAVAIVNHIVQRNLIPNTGLDRLRFTAANVDGVNDIDANDAVQVLRRSALIIPDFSAFGTPDWMFYGQDIGVDLSVNLQLLNLTGQNLRVMAYGDANQSWNPGIPKKNVMLATSTSLNVNPNKEFEVPVTVSAEALIAGYAINLEYADDLVEFAGVSSSHSGVMAVAEDGYIKLAWLDITAQNSLSLGAEDVFVTLKFKPTEAFEIGSSFSFGLNSNYTSFSNPNGQLIGATINIPEVSAMAPTDFSLSQNYPNPFNPSTKIEYALPEAGTVKLIIYDALGREVKSLVNEIQEAGWYTFDWNATGLASGMYIYRLEVKGSTKTFSQVKKLMLLK